MLIKPGITADGFRTAVRDYTESIVVEELAANSYDADASTVLVLLDTTAGKLYVLDDGNGFSRESISEIATLGGGDKREVPVSRGKRPYLGSYGYGLKSTLNIASKIEVYSASDEGAFKVQVDWSSLERALRPDFDGFPCEEHKPSSRQRTGSLITLRLRNPTSAEQLEEFGAVLANLPTEDGGFRCYYGLYSGAAALVKKAFLTFKGIPDVVAKLHRKNLVSLAGTSIQADLGECQQTELQDKEDKSVKAKIYFSGIVGGKVRPLKRGLRGIYVRIHGRLLKQNFTDRRFTYNISKWVKFESGLRVEITVDWLRDQISLSRTGIRFASSKLEQTFGTILVRLVSGFIQPQLQKLQAKSERAAARKHSQRLELCKKRVHGASGRKVSGLAGGFCYVPETDGELALLVAQEGVLAKVNKNYALVDYNDQANFDCVVYDKQRRDNIFVELEPTLPEFLVHNDTSDVQAIITWSLGKWRVGALKKGKNGAFKLVTQESGRKGRYKLLEYASVKSRTPRKDYEVIALDEILASG